MASLNLSMHRGLRQENMTLEKRIIELETVEAEKERLRNDLIKIKNQMNKEKAQMELDFMNQVSAISQANALKVEEIECRLKESNSVNRILSEQLEQASAIEKQIQAMEVEQEKEIARIVDNKMDEIDEVRQELTVVKKSKDDLALKLGEAQTRAETERRKVEELNTSLEQLNASILNDSQAEKARLDAMEAQLLNAEKENEHLRNQLIKAEEETRKNITQAETIRDLRDTIRSRDLELNSKIEEIRRMEMLQEESNSRVGSVEDAEKENQRLKKELDGAIASRHETELAVSRLENDNRRLNDKLVALQDENSNLVANLHESTKHATLNKMAEDDSALAKLQASHRELKYQFSRLQLENNEMKSKLKEHISSNLQQMSKGVVVRERNSTGGSNNRTSQIIKQLEQNLKREGQTKQNATQAMKDRTEKNNSNDINIPSLRAELNSVMMQLDDEHDISERLSTELRDIKGSKVRARHESSAMSKGVKENCAKAMACSGVKEIAQIFEKKFKIEAPAGNNSICPLMERVENYPRLTDDLQQLQENLIFQRRQVRELEDELTRQCEINCMLLKEISDLSCDNEAVRKASSQSYGMMNNASQAEDQKEINRMIMEVASLKSQLFNEAQSKSTLEERYNVIAQKHKKEINALKQQLEHAETATRSARSRMEESSSLDKKEIETLRKKLNDCDDDAKGYNNRIAELEADLKQSKHILAEEKTKSSQQIESLQSQIEALQASLTNAEEARTSLSIEREALCAEIAQRISDNDDMERKIDEQQEQFAILQKIVDEKVQAFEQLRCEHKEESSRLRDQVKSLEQDLSTTLENAEQLQRTLQEKEDMESAVDELSRKNVQGLHAQINKLQKELIKRQMEVSEAAAENKKTITALEEAVDATQMEMEESLREKGKEVADLKAAIEDKERKVLLLEREKEQLVLSMNDMMKSRRDEIDDLQRELMEMSTRSANQTREVQMLKLQLQETGYRKDEMDRLRTRVTELGAQLASRKDPRGRDTPSLEIKNNELREKLRDAVAERQHAEEKLREYVADKGSKQVQVLRERNAALKHEVEKLTKKMKKLTATFRTDSLRHTDDNEYTSEALDPDIAQATRFVI